MDKNEILEKSRKENQLRDECAAVQVYHLALGLDNSLPLTFFLGYVACEALGRYQARREKHLLVVGCLGAVGSLLSLASYVMDTLPALQG